MLPQEQGSEAILTVCKQQPFTKTLEPSNPVHTCTYITEIKCLALHASCASSGQQNICTPSSPCTLDHCFARFGCNLSCYVKTTWVLFLFRIFKHDNVGDLTIVRKELMHIQYRSPHTTLSILHPTMRPNDHIIVITRVR